MPRTTPIGTRSDLEATHATRDIAGLPHITDVGEFDHEPIWLPYFVGQIRAGEQDRVDTQDRYPKYIFILTARERQEFAECPDPVTIVHPPGQKPREI